MHMAWLSGSRTKAMCLQALRNQEISRLILPMRSQARVLFSCSKVLLPMVEYLMALPSHSPDTNNAAVYSSSATVPDFQEAEPSITAKVSRTSALDLCYTTMLTVAVQTEDQ